MALYIKKLQGRIFECWSTQQLQWNGIAVSDDNMEFSITLKQLLKILWMASKTMPQLSQKKNLNWLTGLFISQFAFTKAIYIYSILKWCAWASMIRAGSNVRLEHTKIAVLLLYFTSTNCNSWYSLLPLSWLKERYSTSCSDIVIILVNLWTGQFSIFRKKMVTITLPFLTFPQQF